MELRVVDDTHGALMDEAPDAGCLCGVDGVARALGVHEPQRLAAVEVARDGHEMEDRVDVAHDRGQGLALADVAQPDLDTVTLHCREPAEHELTSLIGADHRDDAMAAIEQRRDGMPADEAVGAGHEDGGHHAPAGWWSSPRHSPVRASAVRGWASLEELAICK